MTTNIIALVILTIVCSGNWRKNEKNRKYIGDKLHFRLCFEVETEEVSFGTVSILGMASMTSIFILIAAKNFLYEKVRYSVRWSHVEIVGHKAYHDIHILVRDYCMWSNRSNRIQGDHYIYQILSTPCRNSMDPSSVSRSGSSWLLYSIIMYPV